MKYLFVAALMLSTAVSADESSVYHHLANTYQSALQCRDNTADCSHFINSVHPAYEKNIRDNQYSWQQVIARDATSKDVVRTVKMMRIIREVTTRHHSQS